MRKVLANMFRGFDFSSNASSRAPNSQNRGQDSFEKKRNGIVFKGTDIDTWENVVPERHVEWGVKWHQQPACMILFALSGVFLAVGHHLYYSRIDHTLAGSDNKQQWAHTFGNVFAIAVATLFAAANRMAYKQYFWLVVRRRALTIGALDNLFSLTSDLMGFCEVELWKQSTVAVMIALICWGMTFAVFLPPGSLTVIQGTTMEVTFVNTPQLDWTSRSWTDPNIRGFPPAPIVQKLVTQSSQTSRVLDFVPPAPNASYTVDVRGPFLQCEPPNSTHAPVLEYYLNSLYLVNQSTTIAKVTNGTLPLALELFKDNPNIHPPVPLDPPGTFGLPDVHGLVMSAFDPFLGEGADALQPISGSNIEPLNTWKVDLPLDFGRAMGYSPSFCPNTSLPGDTPDCQMFPLQLWMVTSDDAMICTLGNGTRMVNFEFVNGEQTVTYEDLRDFDPVFAPRQIFLRHQVGDSVELSDVDYQVHSYMAVYLSVVNMISGNITMWIPWTSGTPPFLTDKNFVLRTGLDACDEIRNNVWSQNYTNNIFEKPDYMCRNRTLGRAIEDLAANATISMMTSSELTSSKIAEANLSLTQNVYLYKPFVLVLSYGLALLFTIPVMAVGIWAFHSNGVCHSTSLSAIIATTRNPGLDEMSEGHSLGAFPLDREVGKTKLKFGAVEIAGKGERVAFGRINEVIDLKKGGLYI